MQRNDVCPRLKEQAEAGTLGRQHPASTEKGALVVMSPTRSISLVGVITTREKAEMNGMDECLEMASGHSLLHRLELLSLPLSAEECGRTVLDETRLALGKASNVRRDKIFQASVCASFLCTRRRVGAGRIIGRALDARGGRGGDRRFSAVNHFVCGRYRW